MGEERERRPLSTLPPLGGDAEGRGGSGTTFALCQLFCSGTEGTPLCHCVTSPPAGGRAEQRPLFNSPPGESESGGLCQLSPDGGRARAEASIHSPPSGGRCRRQRGVWDDLRVLPTFLLRYRRDPPLSLRDISPRWGESRAEAPVNSLPGGGRARVDYGRGFSV